MFHRPFLRALLGASLLTLATQAAAQTFPDKPLRFIVPFPPGGTTDSIARIVANQTSAILGQNIIVENRPGAGGNIGTAQVAQAEPDGYTLGVVGNSFAVNPALYGSLPFDPAGMRAVALLGEVPFVMIASPAAPFQDVAGLVEQARQPQGLAYASGGNGTVSHLGMHWFTDLAGVPMTHVPYRGVAPAVTDVMGGQVPVMLDTLVNSTPPLQAGRVRPLLVTTAEREPGLPEVPTAAEAGFPDLVFSAWIAVVAPAGTPEPVVTRLNEAVNEALRSPEVVEAFARTGTQPRPISVAETQDYLKRETERWGEVVRSSGAKVD